MEYTNEQLELRQKALKVLRAISNNDRAIYECANEWCKKQYTTNGLASYYKAYYSNRYGNNK